jgi:hypothetical protein
VYQKVFECSAADAVHVWEDNTVSPGVGYYYYIQSKDDGTQNDVRPGTPLYRSMFFTMTSLPTSIPTDVEDRIGYRPEEFALHQNYPNLFNLNTEITYSIGINSQTSLNVYDVLGREVAVLVNEIKSAGTHTLQWNASAMPSGVYFYRLQAGSFSETKKLVLLR